MKTAASFLPLLIGIVFVSSAAFGDESAPPRAGVMLTFDDRHNIQRWVRQLPLFAKYEAKATFFIERPDQLDESRKESLKQLAAAGHEIGCHGFRHLRGPDVVKNMGAGAYLEEEIQPARDILEKLGYPQKSFAYPMSARNRETDEVLKPLFRRVRSGGGNARESFEHKDILFTPVDQIRDCFVVTGVGVDYLTEETLEKNVLPGLERVKSKGEILVFYAHGISDEEMKGHHIRSAMLEMLLKRIKDLDLEFHTFGGP